MNLETKAYQHALSVWQNFHSTTRISAVDGSLPTRRIAWEDHQDRILRALPPVERTPSAIGLFVRNARRWSTERKREFLTEFVPSPPPVVGEFLKAAAMGEVIRPRKLPVTLEEFPSRILQRALASGYPERLVGASYLACHATARLIERHRHDAVLGDLMPFWNSAGDLPSLIDLAAFPPAGTQHLKDRILERLMEKLRSGDFQPTFKDMESIKTWVLGKSAEGPSLIETLASEAKETAAQRIKNGRLRLPYDTRRLGRLMFRLGIRRHSYDCAKALGESPWKNGWQHQVVSAEFHSRIRQRIHHGADTWMSDPALACSSMTIPLWLTDGVERVSSLSSLFFRATECPWMFPRLQHIYQWHLALADKQEALREIAQLAPDLAAGLSKIPEQA
jgi:hypothetical protein